jgi:hypothetical protein
MQTLPEQQPLAQEAALQTQAPSAQAWPDGQAVQAEPLTPQALLLSLALGTQPEGEQQPSQVAGSQAHLPSTQAWPAGQAWHMDPLEPQEPAVGVMQTPVCGSQQPWQLAEPHEHECDVVSQVMPLGQSALLLQPQVPAPMQAWPMAEVVQSMQPPPPVPQTLAALPSAHLPFWQQASAGQLPLPG